MEGWLYHQSSFYKKITEAYERDSGLPNLLLDNYFKECIENYQTSWRKVVCLATNHGIPIPTFSSALSYYDGYRLAQATSKSITGTKRLFWCTHL